MRIIFAVVIAVVALAFNGYATAQRGERLIYQGKTNRLATLPLEPYLKKHNLRLSQVSPPKKYMMRTSCWRGYVGTWQIKDGHLWLVSAEHVDGTQVQLTKVFTNQAPPIKATWYSGTLHVTQGKMLRYVHGRFASKFERNIYIKIKEGKVISEEVQENKPAPPGK
jgi:hypothetical protein